MNPISDAGTEDYFAAFELYEGDTERLAVGNALKAWAYGAFNVNESSKTNFNVFETARTNTEPGDFGIDLNSSKPLSAGRGGYFEYELPRKGIERTIVFKVQYLPEGKDLVTVWLDPDLGPGATEAGHCMESLDNQVHGECVLQSKSACGTAAAGMAGHSARWPSPHPSAISWWMKAGSSREARA